MTDFPFVNFSTKRTPGSMREVAAVFSGAGLWFGTTESECRIVRLKAENFTETFVDTAAIIEVGLLLADLRETNLRRFGEGLRPIGEIVR